jgi:hypothetical protein
MCYYPVSMKRKLIFLLIIAGIAGIIFFIFRFLTDRTPKQGVLKVISSPVTTIFLDNRHIGRTSYEDKIAEGEYTIKLTPESSVQTVSSWQGKIKIFRNLLTYVNADLGDSEFNSAIDVLWLERITSKLSEVSVITNPDGAAVLLDGENKGLSPISIADVPVGDHTILITSPGFSQRTVKVKTTAGYKLIATVKLALSGQNFGVSPEASSSPTATVSAMTTPTTKIKTTPSATPKITSKATPTITLITSPKPTQPDPEKPYIIIKDTPTGFLRVRSEPSTTASEIGRVNPGEKYAIADTQNGWYKIVYNGTDEGWISGQYAEKVE